MKEQMVNQIMQKCTDVWKQRNPGKHLDPGFINLFTDLLKTCPDEDGMKRVVDMETNKTHLIPYSEIILNGLKGNEVKNFPEEITNG